MAIELAKTGAIGHMAFKEAYGPDHAPRPGIAHKVALQFGAGLLSADAPEAQEFLREKGITEIKLSEKEIPQHLDQTQAAIAS